MIKYLQCQIVILSLTKFIRLIIILPRLSCKSLLRAAGLESCGFMDTITPPKHVRQVLFTLQSHGYGAYLVGGCVRDMILGVQPNDWDICTSALPEEVMALFPKTVATGLKHGTVTVMIGKHGVEVTTFRSDGEYLDHRHPKNVSYVLDLNTDLSRRDFTMNAMAISAEGIISDPFGGMRDIADQCIRCVGDPELRFEEDALRMFRALRFSARLGFRIEENTLAAIRRKAKNAASISAERVRDEMEKLLLTRSPETVEIVLETGLLSVYAAPVQLTAQELCSLKLLPYKAHERWCMFTWLLLKHGAIGSAEDFLAMLRLDRRTVQCVTEAIEILSSPAPRSALEWKRLLRDYGVGTVSCAARCRDAALNMNTYRELRTILKAGECFSLKHLAVNGDDLSALGLKGQALGETLNFLLEYVMEFPENNRRELLMYLAAAPED